MTVPVPADVISRLKAVLGEGGWSQDPDRLAPKLVEWRERWSGTTPLLALPKTTAEVAAVVGVCAESGTAITPQGGNTGLVGGQIPDGEILLSTERLSRVRYIDVLDDVIEVEAGATLAAVHDAALAAGRRFPLNLASEGSATIGGLISTNAGGTAVLRYGTMRALVLGVEAVLPDGAVWNGLKRLRKDNTGYDLKQLLIGAEGTLGVVTAASLKLFPIPASRAVAFVGLATPVDAVACRHLPGDDLDQHTPGGAASQRVANAGQMAAGEVDAEA
jgi:FAD/FMN-containing dehydrogenase